MKRWQRWRRRVTWAAGIGLLAGVGLVAVCNLTVLARARDRRSRDLHDLPEVDVGLVLGCAPGSVALATRLDAAAELHKAGRVRHLLVSGDNGSKHYDEPSAMRRGLEARGVPPEAITVDYAGFRTLDSVVRARQVFGVDRLIVVSQGYHTPRAVFLARNAGIDAYGYDAAEPTGRDRASGRELLARVLAVLDVTVLQRQPRFDGPPEPIEMATCGDRENGKDG